MATPEQVAAAQPSPEMQLFQMRTEMNFMLALLTEMSKSNGQIAAQMGKMTERLHRVELENERLRTRLESIKARLPPPPPPPPLPGFRQPSPSAQTIQASISPGLAFPPPGRPLKMGDGPVPSGPGTPYL